MKQRRKILLALLLSASVATTPVASIPVLAEDLDIASEEIAVESEEDDTDVTDDSNVTDDSVLADDAESADLTVEEDVAEDTDADMDSTSTDLFSDGEVDEFSADGVSAQDATEAKTHSIKVTVNNKTSDTYIYGFKNVIVTQQEDGTYLVRMQSNSDVRDYIAFAESNAKTDLVPVTNHEVDWYHGTTTTSADNKKEVWYTIPVKSLTDPIYLAFNSQSRLNDGKKWEGPYLLKFDLNSMTDTTEKDANISDVNTVPATVTKTSLAVTNNTGMFKVTSAILKKDEKGKNLIITLSGQGYHYLYKGTYEEASANGDNRDNWIAGVQQADKSWQFTIPVAEGESHLPIVAISNSYLTKYENGQNSLERAFYPRQAVIDENAQTLVTGDYDHTKDLTVTNGVKMFKVGAASLETIGGPNSNGYKELLHLTMGSDSFDKVYIGSAADAAKAETTTAIADRKADLIVKANAMGGEITTDYLDKDVVFSFHSVKNNTWYERVFNINKTNSTLNVVPISATAITLDSSSKALIPGTAFKLTAAVTPSNTTDTLTWSSSASDIATVAKDGTVTALKEGSAIITATAGAFKAECKVTISKTLSITVNVINSNGDASGMYAMENAIITKQDDGTYLVRMHQKSTNRNYMALTDDATKATNHEVDWYIAGGDDGYWYTIPVSNLTDSIHACFTSTDRLKNGKPWSTVQTISFDSSSMTETTEKDAVASDITIAPITATDITLNATTQTIETGKSFKLTTTVTPANTTDKVTWSSSNEAVAKVADDGTVTAVKAGTAVITATAGNVKTECTITVTAPATKITLNTTRQKLEAGKSFTLIAAVAPADTTDKVVWSSNNTKVATVSSNGTVKALKAGTAVITVKAGNVKATCTFTVANPVVKVSGVKLAATPSRSIAAGRRVQLKAAVAPSNATNKGVTWTSSNKKVATVNANGVVTFNKKAGGKKVVITATAKDGSKKYAKITLTCMKGSVKRIKLSGTTTVKAGKTTKVKATVTTQNGKANKSVVWTSSNTKLATVDRYGKVKTVKGKKGTVTITAKATDGSGKKATIKIRIK